MRRLVRLVSTLLLVGAMTPSAPASAGTAGSLRWTTFTAEGNGASVAGVDSLSPRDAWAVGLRLGGPCQYRTLAERWGDSWTVVQSPNVPGVNTVLNGVAMVSARDVWAVGQSSCPTVQRGRTLVEHWDGSRWRIVPSPNAGRAFDTLAAVEAVSATDVWAVGSSVTGSVGSGLVEHWDGHAWTVVPSPRATSTDSLEAVSASSGAEVWAVGSGVSGPADSPLAMRWDGAGWKVVPVPTPGGAHGFLFGVAAVSPAEAWAVGGYRPGGGGLQPLLERWDGTAWRVVPAPDVGGFAALNDVARGPGGALGAVGFTVNEVESLPVVLRRSPRGWVQAQAPPGTDLQAVSAVGEAELWAVSGPEIAHGLRP
jgi:hypothetical protein